jgi:hypothetical protein
VHISSKAFFMISDAASRQSSHNIVRSNRGVTLTQVHYMSGKQFVDTGRITTAGCSGRI